MSYSFFQPLSIYEQGKRDNQEDSIFPKHQYATSADRLFILCDGMGGYEKGEVASSTICEHLSHYLLQRGPFSDKLFHEALEYSYEKLCEKAVNGENRMGTTLTLLFFHEQGCFAAHIGDSRIYHIRPDKHQILFVSRDHSLVNDLLDAGMLAKEDVANFPQRHVITRAIRMDKKISRSDVDVHHIKDIQNGDYFLMMSDGMLENLSEDELLHLVCRKDLSNEEKRNWLIENSAGNSDNHSAYIIHINNVHELEKKKIDYWKIAFFILCALFAIFVYCFF